MAKQEEKVYRGDEIDQLFDEIDQELEQEYGPPKSYEIPVDDLRASQLGCGASPKNDAERRYVKQIEDIVKRGRMPVIPCEW